MFYFYTQCNVFSAQSVDTHDKVQASLNLKTNAYETFRDLTLNCV